MINEVERDLRRTRDLTLLSFPFVQLLGTETCSMNMRKVTSQQLESQGRGKSLKPKGADTVWRELSLGRNHPSRGREKVCVGEMGLWPHRDEGGSQVHLIQVIAEIGRADLRKCFKT